MDKAQLLALADRVEALTGPDRGVDGLVASAFDRKHGPDSGFCNSDNGDYWTVDECAPHYTASIDAAMTLVPEGWQFCVTNGNGAWVRFSEHHPTIHGGNAHPAIALTAASLRAMAGGDDGDN